MLPEPRPEPRIDRCRDFRNTVFNSGFKHVRKTTFHHLKLGFQKWLFRTRLSSFLACYTFNNCCLGVYGCSSRPSDAAKTVLSAFLRKSKIVKNCVTVVKNHSPAVSTQSRHKIVKICATVDDVSLDPLKNLRFLLIFTPREINSPGGPLRTSGASTSTCWQASPQDPPPGPPP